jgi:hypothetical protein
LQEQVKWFGALSTLQNITVNPKPIVPPVGVTPKTVRFVYLVSSDRTMRSDYRDAIDMASKNIQAWYQDKLDGYTFTLNNPAVEVAYSDKSAAWFTTNPNGTDQNSWGFYNTLAEASRLLGAKQFDPDYIWVLYSDGPGNSGRGGAGVAYLPEDDLLGLIGQHPTQPSINRWIGGMGHELGHALGLPHPTDTLADYQALMYAGFYNYPDAYLTISDKTTLLGSSFITYKGPVVPPVPVPERFTHSTGDFTHSQIDPGGTWLETSTLSTNTYTFNETSRDATYIYTIDLNRNMQLKLPIAGGMCYWSVDNGVTWNGLYTLTKV